jgi:transposase
MDQSSIFSAALGLSTSWRIKVVDVSQKDPRIDIYIISNHSALLPCPVCGKEARISSISDESWHHSDFFHKDAYVHIKVPVVTCDSSCGCHKLNAPWSKSGSRFILLKDTK